MVHSIIVEDVSLSLFQSVQTVRLISFNLFVIQHFYLKPRETGAVSDDTDATLGGLSSAASSATSFPSLPPTGETHGGVSGGTMHADVSRPRSNIPGLRESRCQCYKTFFLPF
jgi:hypothetical protein